MSSDKDPRAKGLESIRRHNILRLKLLEAKKVEKSIPINSSIQSPISKSDDFVIESNLAHAAAFSNFILENPTHANAVDDESPPKTQPAILSRQNYPESDVEMMREDFFSLIKRAGIDHNDALLSLRQKNILSWEKAKKSAAKCLVVQAGPVRKVRPLSQP